MDLYWLEDVWFSGRLPRQVPLCFFLAPNWPRVTVLHLQSICICVLLMAALMRCTLKGSCSHSHTFPLDSISVPCHLVSRSRVQPASPPYTMDGATDPLPFHSGYDSYYKQNREPTFPDPKPWGGRKVLRIHGPQPQGPRNPKSTHGSVPRIKEFWAFVLLSERDFDWQS